jgi:hypothetical protein
MDRGLGAPACAAGLALFLLSAPTRSDDAPRCKGTKQWYAGKCLYPDEIEALKQQQPPPSANPPPPSGTSQPPLVAPRLPPKTDRDKQAREQQLRQALASASDEASCELSREIDSAGAWRSYLDKFPTGSCVKEARVRITILESRDVPAVPVAQPTSRNNALFWGGFGAALGSGTLWAAAGGLAISAASDLRKRCVDGKCPPTSDGEIRAVTALTNASTAGAVVCIASVGVAITGLLLPEIKGKPKTEGTCVSPVLGLGSVGFTGRY